MSPIFTSKRKSFLDFYSLFFPRLCISCAEKCQTKLLCPECWELCSLPDPLQRCRHCFEPVEERDLCWQCREKPILKIPRAYVFDPESPARSLGVDFEDALASFAIWQWVELDWPIFDFIVPMPDRASIRIALSFCRLMQRPMVRAIDFLGELKRERLEEDQLVLLFDVSNSIELLKKVSDALLQTSPKKLFLLSLYPEINIHK